MSLVAALWGKRLASEGFGPRAASTRRLSIDTQLSERERAAEAVYFQKEEKELLKKIAQKVNTPSASGRAAEEAQLKSIFEKHGVSPPPALMDDVMAHFRSHAH